MENSLRIEITQSGGMQEIRLLRTILQEIVVNHEVEMIVDDDHLEIRPVPRPRQGWAEAFSADGDEDASQNDTDEIKIMRLPDLPASVKEKLGREAASDIVRWLESALDMFWAFQHLPVSPEMARQKVSMVLDRIDNMLQAGLPVPGYREDGTPVWRVPIDLISPTKGNLGTIGAVDVDGWIGGILASDQDFDRIREAAARIHIQ